MNNKELLEQIHKDIENGMTYTPKELTLAISLSAGVFVEHEEAINAMIPVIKILSDKVQTLEQKLHLKNEPSEN